MLLLNVVNASKKAKVMNMNYDNMTINKNKLSKRRVYGK
jgi:hypothetical protein